MGFENTLLSSKDCSYFQSIEDRERKRRETVIQNDGRFDQRTSKELIKEDISW